MLSGVRFFCEPAAPLQAHLRVWIGHQRHIKNCKVKERNALRAQGASPLDDQKYAHLITEEKAFLKDVPSQILRNGAFRYMSGLQRFKKGLGGAPTVQKKFGRQSVLVTRELFRFLALPTSSSSARHGWVIELGTKAHPIGLLPFHAHREFELPRQITLCVEPDGRWFVSFCYDKAPPLEPDGQELVLHLHVVTGVTGTYVVPSLRTCSLGSADAVQGLRDPESFAFDVFAEVDLHP